MAILLGVILWSWSGAEAKIKRFQDQDGTLHITNAGEEEAKPKEPTPAATQPLRQQRPKPGMQPPRPPGPRPSPPGVTPNNGAGPEMVPPQPPVPPPMHESEVEAPQPESRLGPSLWACRAWAREAFPGSQPSRMRT